MVGALLSEAPWLALSLAAPVGCAGGRGTKWVRWAGGMRWSVQLKKRTLVNGAGGDRGPLVTPLTTATLPLVPVVPWARAGWVCRLHACTSFAAN